MSHDPHPQQPSAFLGGGLPYHPQPVGPSYTQDMRAPYRVPSGPANAEPLLSVSATSRYTLTKPLITALGLGAKSRFRLVVPRKAGEPWYFDTNPRHEEGHRLPERGQGRFRVPPIGRDLFVLPQPQHGAGGQVQANRNAFASLLHFRLGEEVQPGYYRLERVGAC